MYIAMVANIYTIFATHHLHEDSCDVSHLHTMAKHYLIKTFQPIQDTEIVVGDILVNTENGKLILYRVSSLCEDGCFVRHEHAEHKVVYATDINNVLYYTSKALDKNFYTKAVMSDIKKEITAYFNNPMHQETLHVKDTTKESDSQEDSTIESSTESKGSLRMVSSNRILDAIGHSRTPLAEGVPTNITPQSSFDTYTTDEMCIYSDRPFRGQITYTEKKPLTIRSLFLMIATCGMLD